MPSIHPALTSILTTMLSLSGCALVPDSNTTSDELTGSLVNGSFESGQAPWYLYVGNGAAASSLETTSTAVEGHYSEQINISAIAPSCDWCVQLGYGGIS